MPHARPALVATVLDVGPLRFTADVAGPAQGTPVLLLHGFPQSRHAWRHQLPALAEAGLRCVAPDLRGYSPSARPAGAEHYDIDRLLEDLHGILDAIDAPSAHVVGIDWGGQLAWHLAARAPQRVRTLAVLSRPHPNAFAHAMSTDAQQAQRSVHHRKLLEPDAAAKWREDDLGTVREALRRNGVPAEGIDGYLSVLRPEGALEAAISWYVAAANKPFGTPIPSVRVPTLYVWGNADHTVGRAAAEGTAGHVEGEYRFVEIAGAGHFLTDEVPDRVNALLLGLLLREHARRDI